jgi:hypothetical protein
MTPDRKRAILGRLLIYLAIIPLIWLAFVPDSFETLQLFASGKLWPDDTGHAPAPLHAANPDSPNIAAPPIANASNLEPPSSQTTGSSAPASQKEIEVKPK